MTKTMTAGQVLGIRHDDMTLTGMWGECVGTMPRHGVVFIWGNSGNGKSTAALSLCRELTRFGRVLYVSLEEGYAMSLQNAIRRTGLAEAGARYCYLIEEPIAAAIGAGVDIAAARGAMVLDVGGGTTDIAVLSLGSVVLSDTVRVAGDRFDQALIRYMKRKHELAIGERSAEDLKIAYGRAHIEKEQQVVEIRGRSLATGLPEAVPVATNELVDALAEPLRQIMEHVRALFEQTPPELAADITESGICLTGGGAQLRGLDRYIAEHTGVPCRLAEDPASCVAIGTGRVLEDLSAYRAALLDYRRGEFDR